MQKKYKYPRSYHLPQSEVVSSDDKRNSSDDNFTGRNVVVTIKMDGEGSTIYSDPDLGVHARSLDSKIDSEDRRWIQSFSKSKVEGKFSNTIRICGENLFYKHSCPYDNLESMFYAFSVWDGDLCLSWEDTCNICESIGIVKVPVIYEGLYDYKKIFESFSNYKDRFGDQEGFVVRLSDGFKIDDFHKSLNDASDKMQRQIIKWKTKHFKI